MIVVSRLHMPVRIRPVTIIADGMPTPIRMASFPAMKAINPPRFRHHPDVAGSQIVILVAHEADIFIAIPHIIVGNSDHNCWRRGHVHRWWWSRINDCRLRRHDDGFKRDTPIRLDHTARHQEESSRRQ